MKDALVFTGLMETFHVWKCFSDFFSEVMDINKQFNLLLLSELCHSDMDGSKWNMGPASKSTGINIPSVINFNI